MELPKEKYLLPDKKSSHKLLKNIGKHKYKYLWAEWKIKNNKCARQCN